MLNSVEYVTIKKQDGCTCIYVHHWYSTNGEYNWLYCRQAIGQSVGIYMYECECTYTHHYYPMNGSSPREVEGRGQ